MCGIIGLYSIGQLDMREESFFRQALLADTVRGWDSTGIVRLSNDDDVHILKGPMNAGEFLEKPEVREMLNRKGAVGYIGHNRSATIGQVNMANAHPFNYGKITLVHNGTLDTVYELDDPIDGGETDSEQIAYTMAQKGESATLSLVDGAYTLAWMNEEDNSFNLARNSERPLYYAFDNAGTSVFFASENKMLAWLLDRNRIYHKEILPLKANIHYKIQTGKASGKPCIKVKEYSVVKKSRYPMTHSYGGSPYSKRSFSKETEFNYLGIEPYHGNSEHGKLYGVSYADNSQGTQVVAAPVKIDEYSQLDPWELLKGVLSYSAKYTAHDKYRHYINNNLTQIVIAQDTIVPAYPSQAVCDNCYSYGDIAYTDGESKLCIGCIEIGRDLMTVGVI